MGEMPSIQQLEYFIIYGRVKNFTLAAKEANITQSAFSAQMKKLETLLGVHLIMRSNRGSCLTQEGEEFLQRISTWMAYLHEIVYDFQTDTEKAPVELHIGILRSLGDVLMNRHVAYFQKHHPHIMLNVYDMEEEEILLDLQAGHIDVASVYLLRESVFNRYEKVHFCSDTMVYFAPCIAGLPSVVHAATMGELPFVQYPPKYLMHEACREYFKQNAKEPPIAANLSTPYAMIHFCNQNRAGALLPERLLHALENENGWYRIFPEMKLDACLIYKKDNPKYRAIRTYVDYILRLNLKK
jgi:DNA-binding transcriptional LysR family regulator